jgi:MYXO-CTERM domain-containing protein
VANFPIFGLSSPTLGERMPTTSTGGSRPRGRSGRGLPFRTRAATTIVLLAALGAPGSAFAGASGPDAWRAGLAVEQDRAVPLIGRAAEVRHRSYTLHGVPLRRAHATVLADDEGERVVREALPAGAPDLLPTQARLAAAEAVALAREHARGTRPAPPAADGDGELVYIVILGVPVLAYEVDLELALDGPEPSKKTVWISAHSGIVLDEWEHVRASQARVFLTNPAKTPEPIVVELSGVHATGPGEPLVGDVVQSYNCTLEPQPVEELPAWWKEGKCYPVHRALSNEDGDFEVPLPDIVLPQDNSDGDDAYAELSMYWNAERFLDRMAELGVTKFKCDLSTMLANYRDPKLSPSYPDLPYTPLNNAYWTNTCDPEKGVTMIFGQGSAVDFGYDGDVVYHELGHGMVSLLTPDGLGARRNRHDGVLTDAGGINEAVADYFSVMLTNEPELGDYVARFWPGYGDSIRSAENQKTCPDDTVGQVHNDGEPFMAALWATRKRVGGDKLDPLVIDLLPLLPIDADLEEASLAVLELAEDAGWSATELDHLIRAFDTRGLYDCPRIITDPERVVGGRSMYLRPKTTAVTPFLPGPMQLRHEVPEGADNVVVRFRKGGDSGVPGNPSGVLVLIKRADEPMEFTYTLTALDKNADGSSKASVREVTTVAGDWDLALQATLLGDSDNQLVMRGFRPGEVVHVTLAAVQTSETTASSVAVLSLPTEFLDEGSVHVDVELGESESEAAGDAGVVTPEVDVGDAAASCACRGEPGGAGWLLPGLLGLGLRRRRRG